MKKISLLVLFLITCGLQADNRCPCLSTQQMIDALRTPVRTQDVRGAYKLHQGRFVHIDGKFYEFSINEADKKKFVKTKSDQIITPIVADVPGIPVAVKCIYQYDEDSYFFLRPLNL